MKKFITKKNIRTVSAKTSARGRKIMASTDMSADCIVNIMYVDSTAKESFTSMIQ